MIADSAQQASVMVIGREEVLPIELLEKHTVRRDAIYVIFPYALFGCQCPLLMLI